MRQAQALDILKTGANVFLTGEPGSGKTHTVNAYIRYLREHKIEPSVTASTGVAATHVNGMTVHSWSGIGIKSNITDYDIELMSEKERLVKRVVGAKILIIDEISMLDAKVLENVDFVCRKLRRREESFGGLQIVFVGDFFQLPPIGRYGAEPVRFAYDSQAWKEANVVVCYLTEQHRQEDEEYLDMLSQIRRGQGDESIVERLSDRRATESSKKNSPRLYTHNFDVDKENFDSLSELPGKTESFEMTSQGNEKLVEALKKSCISPEKLLLKEGASVMFTKNNFEEGFVNGTLGKVVGFDTDDGYPLVRTVKGREIKALPVEWSIEDGKKVLAKVTQVPLRLAWAITVHKSQGMSMDRAVVDLSRAFEYGQGYVALSRVRTQSGLSLLGINEQSLMVHPEVLVADEVFRSSSDIAVKIFSEMKREELVKLHENFITAMGGVLKKRSAIHPKAVSTERERKHPVVTMEERRKKYPNAYRPWGEADDVHLRTMYESGIPRPQIAKHFGRNAGAIRSRLVHLGLIDA